MHVQRGETPRPEECNPFVEVEGLITEGLFFWFLSPLVDLELFQLRLSQAPNLVIPAMRR